MLMKPDDPSVVVVVGVANENGSHGDCASAATSDSILLLLLPRCPVMKVAVPVDTDALASGVIDWCQTFGGSDRRRRLLRTLFRST